MVQTTRHSFTPCALWGLGLVAMLALVTSTTAAADRPVTIEASAERIEDADFKIRLQVTLEIADGWHTYDRVKVNSPYATTHLKLELPKNVKAIETWNRPVGLPSIDDPETFTYQGLVTFTHDLTAELSEPTEAKIRVAYQVCRGEVCQPPQTQVISVTLPATIDAADDQEFASKIFHAPKRLMVADVPLNTNARQMYPSPAMFDVDRDGQVELVVGDIFGALNVYENIRTDGDGEPVWSRFTPLKSTDGKPIKVSNW